MRTCVHLHDHHTMPQHLPADLTSYVVTRFADSSSPHHVTPAHADATIVHFIVDGVTVHKLLRCRDDRLAVVTKVMERLFPILKCRKSPACINSVELFSSIGPEISSLISPRTGFTVKRGDTLLNWKSTGKRVCDPFKRDTALSFS